MRKDIVVVGSVWFGVGVIDSKVICISNVLRI
jgi:hypothetical protein